MLPLIFAAVMVGQQLLQSKGQDDQAKVDNILKKSNDRVAKTLRNAENQMSAAKDSLTRYQQSQSNKFKLMTGGDTLNAQATNMLRVADSMVQGGFERRIAAAEEAGALAASAGSAGVAGGSLDIVERTSQMRVQRVEQAFAQRNEQMLADAELEMDQTERAMILGLDDVQVNTSLNYMEQRTQETPRVDWATAGIKAGLAGMQAYVGAGGTFGSTAPTTQLPQQSPASFAPQQSPAVSTSPFGHRPAPTLRMK